MGVRYPGLVAFVFFALLWLTGCGSAADRILEQTIEQSWPIDPAASISIRNLDGSIQVYGSDTAQLKLQVIKKAYTAERLNAISVNVSPHRDNVSIETKFPPKKKWSFSDRSGTVDYIIVIPKTLRISHLELVNGEVLIDGMRGENVRANLTNGRLFGRNCFSDLHLAVTNGGLDVSYDWWEQRRFSVDAQIVNGNARAFIPGDASFHLVAEAVNGKIANDFAEKEQRNGSTVNKIDMTVGEEPSANIKVYAEDGNIKITEQNP